MEFRRSGREIGYTQNLKLINVPVLKHHDEGGSEVTESLKHFYGVYPWSTDTKTGATTGAEVQTLIRTNHHGKPGPRGLGLIVPPNTSFTQSTRIPGIIHSFSGVDRWLTDARIIINGRGACPTPMPASWFTRSPRQKVKCRSSSRDPPYEDRRGTEGGPKGSSLYS